MATFTFRKIEDNESDKAKFDKAAAQTMGGASASPFKNGVTFVPSGSYGYLVTNEGTDKERYNLVLEGKVAGVDTYLWASTLLKTGINKELQEVVPQGLNSICINANMGGMTNRQAGDFLLSQLKTADGSGYKSLIVKRIPFTTLYNGNEVIRTLIQFDIKD